MLDRHSRRAADATCVIGVLLGAVNDTAIDVTNYFGVPGTDFSDPVRAAGCVAVCVVFCETV